MKKQIILTLAQHTSHGFNTVLETKTSRYRSKSEDFYDFISSAADFTDGGNTIVSTKDYIELNKSNLEMKERIRKMEDLISGIKRNIERSTAVKLNFMTTDSIEYEYLCKLLSEKTKL